MQKIENPTYFGRKLPPTLATVRISKVVRMFSRSQPPLKRETSPEET